MTERSELLREEAERLSALMSTAQKIMSLLASGQVPLSYDSCDIVLDIVRSSMDRIRGESCDHQRN